MQFVFLDMAGQTLFIRDDAETASWAVEEQTLTLDFPYVADKITTIGQRVYFRNPATDEPQIYEIKTVKTVQPDGVQQITAEHICISELTDDFMERKELTDVSCSAALNVVLTGTLWQVGNISVNPVASANLDRGSVWQAVLNIQTNWNVYIVPRVVFSNGVITRYLDIKSTDGEWNGLRLSIDKNMLDPSVTYDDTDLVTALYGFGGTVLVSTASGEEKETTFADVVWAATADHPAKPAGQTYIEDPAATSAYGRNGRKRFGFYQNTDVTDPEKLLELTWQTLKKSSSPTISIEGSVSDLYRLGYADQPIKLHDIALVEVLPAGFKQQIQIIRLDVDLLDPSSTQVTIGAYIPNIVYISRDTNENITGTRGGSKNKNDTTTERHEFETAVESIDNGTGLRFRAFQNDLDDLDNDVKKQEARITLTYNKIEQEVVDRRNADGVLSGRITVEANKITQIVQNVGKDGQVTAASIVLAINDAGESEAHIDANKVYIGNKKSTTVINGKITLDDVTAAVVQARVSDITQLSVNGLLLNGNMVVGINGAISITASKLTLSNTAGSTVSTITPKDLLRAVQIVSSGNGYKLQYKEAFDSEWTDAGSFNRAVSLSGTWNSGVYSVSATAGEISGAAPTTTLYDLGLGTTITKSGKTVSTTYDIGYAAVVGGQMVRGGSTGKTGTVSLNATSVYDDGWDYGLTQVVRTARAATSQEITIKSLSFGERWTIVDTKTNSSGATSETTYTVEAPANPYPQSKTMTCTAKTFSSSQWEYTFKYYNSSNIFNTNTNYKFHNNSSYT
jgi:phage minor structural protein